MFDSKARKWRADCENEDLLRWSREPANADQPEAQFLRADALLEKSARGGDVAEAVELMESAAKQEYPQAMFAMGQMYYWGWAVHKDRALALEWYRRAAQQNYLPAQKELEQLKRRRIINIASVCAAVVVLTALAAGMVYTLSGMSGMRVIRVNKNTQLVEPTSFEDFMGELSQLVAQYDDELVISGQVSTNRLLLQLDGNKLDLRDFLADKVVARNDNYIVIQFATEEEAQRCLEALQKQDGIRFVELDRYDIQMEQVREQDSTLPIITSEEPVGGRFNSWGIADMGIDQLRDYVAANYPNNVVEIAVIDSGISPYVEGLPQIVENFNVVTLQEGSVPHHHGTHVTGTVWEGVLGTNTLIHCLDVFNGKEASSASSVETAIQACIDSGSIDVITKSMSSLGHSEAVVQAIQRAVYAGIVFVNSAGNNAIDVTVEHSCPAEMEEIIVVGAYDINHKAAEFTNYGSTVDVCAPGVNIYSFSHEWDGMVIPMNGTSMSTPHVAALACLVKLMYPDTTPAQVEMYIKDYCRTFRNPDMYATGLYGAGAPDATKFMETDPD